MYNYYTKITVKENKKMKGRKTNEKSKTKRYYINSHCHHNNCTFNISRLPHIFEYTTINENHLQFEYVVFLMYNINMAKGR